MPFLEHIIRTQKGILPIYFHELSSYIPENAGNRKTETGVNKNTDYSQISQVLGQIQHEEALDPDNSLKELDIDSAYGVEELSGNEGNDTLSESIRDKNIKLFDDVMGKLGFGYIRIDSGVGRIYGNAQIRISLGSIPHNNQLETPQVVARILNSSGYNNPPTRLFIAQTLMVPLPEEVLEDRSLNTISDLGILIPYLEGYEFISDLEYDNMISIIENMVERELEIKLQKNSFRLFESLDLSNRDNITLRINGYKIERGDSNYGKDIVVTFSGEPIIRFVD